MQAQGQGQQQPFMSQSRQVFDGRRMRMPITRRTVDHGASMAQYIEDQRSATRPLSHDPYAALEPKPEYLINVFDATIVFFAPKFL